LTPGLRRDEYRSLDFDNTVSGTNAAMTFCAARIVLTIVDRIRCSMALGEAGAVV